MKYLAIILALITTVGAEKFCMTIHAPAEARGGGQGGSGGGKPTKVAELHAVLDTSMIDLFGTVETATAEIESALEEVNQVYFDAARVVHLASVSVGDYPITDPILLIGTFRQDQAPGDLTMLFTARDLDGPTLGIAFIDTVCTNSNQSVTQWLSNRANFLQVIAHELGHTWGLIHCACPGHLMNPSVSGSLMMTPESISDLKAAVRHAKCLDRVKL